MANKKKREPRIRESRPQDRTQPRQQSKPHAQQRGRQPAPRAKSGPSRTTLVWGVVAAAVVVAVVIILVSLMGRSTEPPATAGESSTKGSPDAKVTVVEYSDFQCPYCAQFALQTFPSIDQNYVQTGKVRWTFHNMARIGNESKQAAQAAECAGEQGKFWPYHDKIFANQKGENLGAFANDKLKGFAKDLGLDVSAFGSCLDSGKYTDLVNRELVEANQRGVTGTPTFFVNGKKLEGALPYGDFQKALDAALIANP